MQPPAHILLLLISTDSCSRRGQDLSETQGRAKSDDGSPRYAAPPGSCHAHQAGQSTQTFVVALVVHAAADGLAVGVANMSPSMRLAAAVGAAMVLHKGPVAFGFVSHLMTHGMSTAKVLEARPTRTPFPL
jgi:zinc transporter ZupT